MKIVSYNIHKGTDSNNNYRLKEITKYLEGLGSDVICLQEVLYHQFIKMKSSLDMDGVFAANVDNKVIKYGICTLSKYKIKSSNHFLLSSKKEQRGTLFINIDIGDEEKINIINTHLGLDKDERNTQILEILSLKNRFTGSHIICGDFNERNIYMSNYYDSAIYLKKYKEETFPNSNARIDYIFVDKKYIPKVYMVDKINLSDHYPIICII